MLPVGKGNLAALHRENNEIPYQFHGIEIELFFVVQGNSWKMPVIPWEF